MLRSTLATSPAKVTLEVAAPYDAVSMLEFLRRRAVPGIEAVEGSSYARTVRLPRGAAVICLDVASHPVEGRFWLADDLDLATCVQRSRDLLDLDADPVVIDGHLADRPALATSVAEHPGLRVPGHVDGFEVAVRAIVGQQISVSGARTILGQLVAACGASMVAPFGLTHLFPAPQVVAALDPVELPMPRSRGRALVALAKAVARNDLVLDRTADRQAVRRDLLVLPGIGPWTADYVALRALGDTDVFMSTDLGVRQGLLRMGLDDVPPDVVDAWSPWRSYAMMHVWKSLERPT